METAVIGEIISDFKCIRERDPAARGGVIGWLERVTCYSGFHALFFHRIAHALHAGIGFKFIARLVSQWSRFLTGLEIHPGAQISRGVFIDHGFGVVIGETAIIGENVTLFQGVTLGGTGKESGKRHPTLEANVVVGTGAKVLGDITVSEGARIGAGSVVVMDVPKNATVVGVPGRIVLQEGVKVAGARLDHGNLPDPIREAMENLVDKVEHYERLLADRNLEPLNGPNQADGSGSKADASGGFGGQKKDILEEIADHKRREVILLKDHRPLERVLENQPKDDPVRDFAGALRGDGIRLISEIKHKSPSAGVIREDFDPPAIARAYESAGASAISILTDLDYFGGRVNFLCQARKEVKLPLLRKDFIVDPYQIHESREHGADAILLIVKILDKKPFTELLGIAGEVGLHALVEVHDGDELDIALEAGAKIVGINNRNLSDFTVDLQTTFDLTDRIPDDVTVVSESGIKTRDDLDRLQDAGVHAVLVGESLMRQPDLEDAVRKLLQPSAEDAAAD